MTTDPRVVTPETLRDWPLPAPGEDKDARGRLLVVGGSRSSPGAVRLAGEAALRAGAGKLRIATAEPVTAALGLLLPECATVPLPLTSDGHVDPDAAATLVEESEYVDAVLLGPGMTGKHEVVGLLGGVLPEVRVPVVLDALASAYVTADPDGAPTSRQVRSSRSTPRSWRGPPGAPTPRRRRSRFGWRRRSPPAPGWWSSTGGR